MCIITPETNEQNLHSYKQIAYQFKHLIQQVKIPHAITSNLRCVKPHPKKSEYTKQFTTSQSREMNARLLNRIIPTIQKLTSKVHQIQSLQFITTFQPSNPNSRQENQKHKYQSQQQVIQIVIVYINFNPLKYNQQMHIAYVNIYYNSWQTPQYLCHDQHQQMLVILLTVFLTGCTIQRLKNIIKILSQIVLVIYYFQ
eukprot:TRINITY_DN4315_c0_g1_i2.p1 TRINITY_DN4315_c0_g1~~TRINITY_DN4315_c0_g1_i2.p1  ORF type:complete len:198 (+),score=-17.77 TRINITY_DN4315_c0_g1_i2:849-1442(+)